MGSLTGSMTTTAYYIKGELPTDFRDRYLDALSKFRFRPIDVNADLDESIGWVSSQNLFDTTFDLNKVLWGDYFVMSLRVDKIRIPAAALKMHIAEAAQERMDKLGKETLTRDEKDELKDMVQKQLRRRVLPAISVYDVVWNIERNMAWVYTGSKVANDIVQQVFTKTFEQIMVPRTPYTEVAKDDPSPDVLEQLMLLEPTILALPGAR